MKKGLLIAFFFYVTSFLVKAQNDTIDLKLDSLTKFEYFNQKAEALFKVLPVPLYSYSTEAGHIIGLAKYNLIRLTEKDTISQPSKLSELVTISTKGRVKVAVSTDFIWGENKYMDLGNIIFKKQPELFYGIGNDISKNKYENITYTNFTFQNQIYQRVKKYFYLGLGFDIADYTKIEFDSTSDLNTKTIKDTKPNTNFGIVLSSFFDTRNNRYNPLKGSYFQIKYTFYPSLLGNQYLYTKFLFDFRKYYNPWFKHVIALQATTEFREGNVPFYDLAMMGGDAKMRGYYFGSFRDRTLLDTQIEYRMPVWNIFGIAGWLGTGRVAENYGKMDLDKFHLSYGLGLRIKVDSENNTNLRFDWGYGSNGMHGFYINFAEAF